MGEGAEEGGPAGERAPAAGGVTDGSGGDGSKDGAAAKEKGRGGK
jgi:hypothetical protein